MLLARILIICLLPLAISACNDPNDAGPFDRKRMESVVNQVRRESFTGEKPFEWREVAGAVTVVASAGAPNVWARRDQDQHLAVVILTRGGSHWGAGGFAYSDAPFTRTPQQSDTAPSGGCTLDLPGPLRAAYPKKQIDAHWWPVFDNES